jgi:hypothetical protein
LPVFRGTKHLGAKTSKARHHSAPIPQKIQPKVSKRTTTKQQTMEDWVPDNGTDDPVWIDDAWLDTVVVMGITCFILCLMGLSTGTRRE